MLYRCPHCGGNAKLIPETEDTYQCKGQVDCQFTGPESEFEQVGTEASSAEFTGSVTGFDMVDAQVKANNMVNLLLDGTPNGEATLRVAITAAIMEAYKLGQQTK